MLVSNGIESLNRRRKLQLVRAIMESISSSASALVKKITRFQAGSEATQVSEEKLIKVLPCYIKKRCKNW